MHTQANSPLHLQLCKFAHCDILLSDYTLKTITGGVQPTSGPGGNGETCVEEQRVRWQQRTLRPSYLVLSDH
mgnify:FL=1